MTRRALLAVLAAGCVYSGAPRSETTRAAGPDCTRVPATFDAFIDESATGVRRLAARTEGCRVSWDARVFNAEIIPAAEHPDPARRGPGEMERLLLMSPGNPPRAAFDELPQGRRLMLAVPEGLGEGFEGLEPGERVRIDAVLWKAEDSMEWAFVWVRDYRIVRGGE